MSEIPTWWEKKKQVNNQWIKNELIDELNYKKIFNTITFHKETENLKKYLSNADKDIDPKYKNAHFINSEYLSHWNRLDLAWLDDALHLLAKNKEEKIILLWFTSPDHIESELRKWNKIDLFLSYKNTEYKKLPFYPHELFTEKDRKEFESEKNSWVWKIELLKYMWSLELDDMNDMAKKLTWASLVFLDQEINVVWSELHNAMIDVLKGRKKNIILVSWLSKEFFLEHKLIKNLLSNLHELQDKNLAEKIEKIFNNTNNEFMHIPMISKDNWSKESIVLTKKLGNKEIIGLVWKEASQRIWQFRHTLQHKDDPYDMTENEKAERLKEVQKFFPWLEDFDKAMDYILHIKLDLAEPMKWKRIKWVYVDVDGTLIEYVGIHSGKEGTQKLRQEVVDLLKKYESEWKEIVIWTWWDVELKKKYLRSLWITRPVVSKYDYAGATAEIVLDDTDQNAFIAQSKIYPETYINTVTMWTD